jgi:urease accessory protein
MRATARVEVAAGPDGRTRLVDVRSEPPLAVRATPGRVLVVGSAAAPVGGDELDLDVVVGAGARLCLGTAAATVSWPSTDAAWSVARTTCCVGDGGHLTWWPEPSVSVVGSRHRVRTHVELAATASCTVVDEVALGRHGEPSGDVELTVRVRRDGRPLLHHTERLGPGAPGWGGASRVAGARHVLSAVVVGPAAGAPRTVVDASGTSSAWLPLAADAALALVVAPDRPAALAAVALS